MCLSKIITGFSNAPFLAVLSISFVLVSCTLDQRKQENRGDAETVPIDGPRTPLLPISLRDDEFALAVAHPPQSLDPASITSVSEALLITALFQGLTEYDSRNGVRPAGAQNWTVSDGGRRYRFYLNPHSKWSSGRPVKAADFVHSWLRVLDPMVRSPSAALLYPILNARSYHEGQSIEPRQVGLVALDDLTLEVVLENRTPYFLQSVASAALRPVYPETVDDLSGMLDMPGRLISNGAYTYADRLPDGTLLLESNWSFSDASDVSINRLWVRQISSAENAVKAFLQGELDWTGTVDLPAHAITGLAVLPEYHQDSYFGTSFLRFNVRQKSLADGRFRRALSWAVNRDAVVDLVGGGARVAKGMVPPALSLNPRLSTAVKGPSDARRLLQQLETPLKGSEALELLTDNRSGHIEVARALKAMWTSELGLSIKIVSVGWKEYVQRLSAGEYEIARSGWVGDYLDAMSFLQLWSRGDNRNLTGWFDREYEGLLTKATRAKDPAARMNYLHRAESVLLRRGPLMPLFHFGRSYLLNVAVRGFESHLLDQHPLHSLRKTWTCGG